MGSKAKTNEPTVEDLSEQLAILRDDMSALTATMSEMMAAKKDDLADKAEAKADAAKRTAQTAADEAIKQAASAHKAMDELVGRNPGTALAIAAGVGFLVGMISARR